MQPSCWEGRACPEIGGQYFCFPWHGDVLPLAPRKPRARTLRPHICPAPQRSALLGSMPPPAPAHVPMLCLELELHEYWQAYLKPSSLMGHLLLCPKVTVLPSRKKPKASVPRVTCGTKASQIVITVATLMSSTTGQVLLEVFYMSTDTVLPTALQSRWCHDLYFTDKGAWGTGRFKLAQCPASRHQQNRGEEAGRMVFEVELFTNTENKETWEGEIWLVRGNPLITFPYFSLTAVKPSRRLRFTFPDWLWFLKDLNPKPSWSLKPSGEP